jgi:hypothetical protein
VNWCGRIVIEVSPGGRATHWLRRCGALLDDDRSCPAADQHVTVAKGGPPVEFYDRLNLTVYHRPTRR